jgi:hypothetical protein
MATFHDGAGANGELAVAVLALIQAGADLFCRVCGDRVNARAIGITAVRAGNAIRPADFLEVGARLVFVGKNRVGDSVNKIATF